MLLSSPTTIKACTRHRSWLIICHNSMRSNRMCSQHTTLRPAPRAIVRYSIFVPLRFRDLMRRLDLTRTSPPPVRSRVRARSISDACPCPRSPHHPQHPHRLRSSPRRDRHRNARHHHSVVSIPRRQFFPSSKKISLRARCRRLHRHNPSRNLINGNSGILAAIRIQAFLAPHFPSNRN